MFSGGTERVHWERMGLATDSPLSTALISSCMS